MDPGARRALVDSEPRSRLEPGNRPTEGGASARGDSQRWGRFVVRLPAVGALRGP